MLGYILCDFGLGHLDSEQVGTLLVQHGLLSAGAATDVEWLHLAGVLEPSHIFFPHYVRNSYKHSTQSSAYTRKLVADFGRGLGEFQNGG